MWLPPSHGFCVSIRSWDALLAEYSAGIFWTTLVVGGLARSHRDGGRALEVVFVCVFSVGGPAGPGLRLPDKRDAPLPPLPLFIRAMWPPAVSVGPFFTVPISNSNRTDSRQGPSQNVRRPWRDSLSPISPLLCLALGVGPVLGSLLGAKHDSFP